MSPTLKSTGGWVTLGPNLGVFPLEQTRHVGVAKSEHPRLTNDEIIFEEFQPMWSQFEFTNVTDGQTDGQTDRQTTCDRNTALCTKVHRAVTIHQFSENEVHVHVKKAAKNDTLYSKIPPHQYAFMIAKRRRLLANSPFLVFSQACTVFFCSYVSVNVFQVHFYYLILRPVYAFAFVWIHVSA